MIGCLPACRQTLPAGERQMPCSSALQTVKPPKPRSANHSAARMRSSVVGRVCVASGIISPSWLEGLGGSGLCGSRLAHWPRLIRAAWRGGGSRDGSLLLGGFRLGLTLLHLSGQRSQVLDARPAAVAATDGGERPAPDEVGDLETGADLGRPAAHEGCEEGEHLAARPAGRARGRLDLGVLVVAFIDDEGPLEDVDVLAGIRSVLWGDGLGAFDRCEGHGENAIRDIWTAAANSYKRAHVSLLFLLMGLCHRSVAGLVLSRRSGSPPSLQSLSSVHCLRAGICPAAVGGFVVAVVVA